MDVEADVAEDEEKTAQGPHKVTRYLFIHESTKDDLTDHVDAHWLLILFDHFIDEVLALINEIILFYASVDFVGELFGADLQRSPCETDDPGVLSLDVRGAEFCVKEALEVLPEVW